MGSVLVFITVASFSMLSFSDQREYRCATEVPELYCGTQPEVFSESGAEGRQLFMANCAACHKLKGIINRPHLRKALIENEEPYEGFFFTYLSKEDSLQKVKNPYVVALKDTYPTGNVHKFRITEEDYKNLLTYLKELQ
ncbi:MAG: cytochrome c [Flavobacteriaceae bacterium]|nr:cytochrome c [Flavobacteriaceae bacterium]